MLSITITATTRMLQKSTWLSVCALVMITFQLSTVHASCGDYLAEHGMSAHELHLPAGPTDLNQSGAPPKQPSQPCSGPFCRQHEQLPIGPTTPIVAPAPTDMVLVAVTTLDAEVACFKLHVGGRLPLPKREIGRIFKPPKPGDLL